MSLRFFSSPWSIAAIALATFVTSCSTTPSSAIAGPSLSSAQVSRIGQRIWQSECAGTVAGLTSWNSGEEFASLGIGHFIWYPAGYEGPFEESFPQLIGYLRQRGSAVPAWLLATRDCPWASREAFNREAKGERQQQLRTLLAGTVREQTEFIIQRLQNAVPAMIRAGGNAVAVSHGLLAQSPEGLFAMIDYVNFKGEGLNPKERYNGQGWGLAQVLGDMSAAEARSAPAAFAESAKRVLSQRVANAPAARGENRWLAGWKNRCDGYKKPL